MDAYQVKSTIYRLVSRFRVKGSVQDINRSGSPSVNAVDISNT